MNAAHQNQKTADSTGLSACPPDSQLQELVDNALSEADQGRLVSHLDQCDQCCVRLETFAANSEVWGALCENLRWADQERPEQSARLTAAINAVSEPTRLDLTPTENEQAKMEIQLPTNLGSYEILEVLGKGGMGIVYKAFDNSLNRHVALKVVADSLINHPDAFQRFQREARSAAAIRDPHVVSIYAIEQAAETPYLVMEYVPGISLEQKLVNEGPLEWQEIARIGSEAATGLAAAHAAGLVHRDIKPGNILLEEPSGQVKISDFGLARTQDDSGMTQTGCVRGTPEYLSPEQATGTAIDHRSDLFSLGSVLYATCTGGPPFHADTIMGILRRTSEATPTPIHELRDDVPTELVDVIDRLLSKDPMDRFATADEVAQLLKSIERGEAVEVHNPAKLKSRPRRSRSLTNLALLVAACCLLAVGVAIGGPFVGALLAPESPEIAAAQDGDDAKAAASADKPANPSRIGVERVQVITPDAIFRERVQAEKDQIELPRHPLLAREFKGHTGPVSDFAFTPDGQLLLTCSGWPTGDRTVRVWDVETGKELRQFDTAAIPGNPGDSGGREFPREIATISVTPDGKLAITGSTGGAVCVWNIKTGKLVREFKEHTGSVYASAVSPTSGNVLTGGRDNIGRVWNVKTGAEVLQLVGHKSWIRCAAFSPDGNHALTGGYDNVARLWDINKAEMIREIPAGKGWVWGVAFAPEQNVVATASEKNIRLWDISPEGLAAAIVKESVLDVVEKLRPTTRGGKQPQPKPAGLIRTMSTHGSPVTGIAFAPDGRFLISGSYDEKVRLWNVDTGQLVDTLTGHRDWVLSVGFTPDGTQAISTGGGRYTKTGGTEAGIDFTVRLWNLPSSGPRVAK